MLMNQLKMWLSLTCVWLSMISWTFNTWVTVWMTMEVLNLFLVGLMSLNSSYSVSSLMMKFFITQLLISLMFVLFFLLHTLNIFSYCNFICLSILFMKIGMFPFHFWIVSIVGKMNWLSFFMLSTFIKLPPLNLIFNSIELTSLGIFIISSVVVGSYLGINNVIIQKLLVYSSLTHLCWILLGTTLSVNIYFMYFFSYCLTLISLMLILNLTNSFYLNQLKFSVLSKFSNFSLVFIILSLGGFPPFMGFLMKWSLVSFMLYCNLKMTVFVMVLASFLSVGFYFQMFYYIMLIYNVNFKWQFNYWRDAKLYMFMIFIFSFYLLIYFCI